MESLLTGLFCDFGDDNSILCALTHTHACISLQIITIQKIIHSVAAGHMILMCQTDKIHESFYDLFNQTFRSIKGDQGHQDFANIAIGAHSKPCRVDPNFLCFIVIDETELQHCPSPFLNRFEKYYLDHKSILELKLNELPPCLGILMRRVYIQVCKSFRYIITYILQVCCESE